MDLTHIRTLSCCSIPLLKELARMRTAVLEHWENIERPANHEAWQQMDGLTTFYGRLLGLEQVCRDALGLPHNAEPGAIVFTHFAGLYAKEGLDSLRGKYGIYGIELLAATPVQCDIDDDDTLAFYDLELRGTKESLLRFAADYQWEPNEAWPEVFGQEDANANEG